MTLQQALNERMAARAENRLKKLIEVQAPEDIIGRQREIITDWRRGIVRVRGMHQYGAYECTEIKSAKGRGGKVFLVCETPQGPIMAHPGNYGQWSLKPFVPYSKQRAADNGPGA